jgi:DNA-directed RNA polymerase specialized sigma24 family protein
VTDAESRAWHARALAGDETVSADIYERCYETMMQHLARQFPRLDAEEIHDAVTGVIFQYVERPQQYQPDKRSLRGYLQMAAYGDLLNLLKQRERRPRLVPFRRVAHGESDGNSEQEPEEGQEGPEGRVIADAAWEEIMRTLRDILPDPVDRQVLELMMDGERSSTCYARVLGCSDLALDEQRRRVKQAKDRIRVRLKRKGLRFDE